MNKTLPLVTFALLTCLTASSAFAENALIVHLIRSPGLDWSSPRGIAKSTIRNALTGKSWPIGHMMVEVRCGERSFKSGMTQRFSNEDTLVVKKEKQGLGVLFHNFQGRHQDEQAVERSLMGMTRSGRLAVMKFLVSEQSCQRMMEFHDTYLEKQMYKNYGMLSRPLHGEGGGCAAYAMAYPAVGGFLEPWMLEQWSTYVRIPRSVVGGPMTGYQIGVISLRFNAPTRWAREEEPGFPMFFYSPDAIFDWVKAISLGLPVQGNLTAAGQVRRIPVTPDLLDVPVSGNSQIYAVEIDRRDTLPPAVLNFSMAQRDPVEPISQPTALDQWWPQEISVLKAYRRSHPASGPRAYGTQSEMPSPNG